MNWFLIILAIVGFFLTFAVAMYLVALYCSEDDHNQAWLPKIIVVIGLALSAFTVLLLPFDVANKRDPETMDGSTGGIDLATMWQMVLWTIAAWVLFVTPFTTFYYEAWDPNQKSNFDQIRPALGYTLVTAFVFFLLFTILWLTAGYADLDFEGFSSPPVNWDIRKETMNPWESKCCCSTDPNDCVNGATVPEANIKCFKQSGTLSIKVSAFVYIVGLLTAIGWISFIVFGGVGIIALPMDLINDWRMRPEKLTAIEYERRKQALAGEVQELLRSGKALEDKQAAGQKGFFGSTKKRINKFKEQVTLMEKKWERLNDSRDVDRLVILAMIKLPIGIIGIVISLMWILHIIIYNLSKASPFLNNMFRGLDSFFPLFGTLCYAVFALWMLWAAVKGCFKVGCNFGIIQIHPMKVNGTLMSSFLFNTLLVLLTSVTVSQFCAMSFRDYAANTVVDSLFSTYVNNLRGIGYVMRYFQIALLIFSFLAFVYLMIKPCCCKGNGRRDDDDDD
eukprot:TRINITY_DN4656_c2_g1_i1.p1 TRINITY_DN4656_c2_g1~~TRINITY_DN4656_c2_g1_i1.p1  ORF type:complete len:525 (+),score=130.35 TRINITY_DN4656_c2_g1_i1:60-1577(+)